MAQLKKYDYGVVKPLLQGPWADSSDKLRKMVKKVFEEGEPSSAFDALSRVVREHPRAAATVLLELSMVLRGGRPVVDPRWADLAVELRRTAPRSDGTPTTEWVRYLPQIVVSCPHPRKIDLLLEMGNPRLLAPVVEARDPRAIPLLVEALDDDGLVPTIAPQLLKYDLDEHHMTAARQAVYRCLRRPYGDYYWKSCFDALCSVLEDIHDIDVVRVIDDSIAMWTELEPSARMVRDRRMALNDLEVYLELFLEIYPDAPRGRSASPAAPSRDDAFPFRFYGGSTTEYNEGANCGHFYEVHFRSAPGAETRLAIAEAFELAIGESPVDSGCEDWRWAGPWVLVVVGEEPECRVSEFVEGMQQAMLAVHEVAPLEEVVFLGMRELEGDWDAWSVEQRPAPGDAPAWRRFGSCNLLPFSDERRRMAVESTVDAAFEARRRDSRRRPLAGELG